MKQIFYKPCCYKMWLRAAPALNACLNPESNSTRLAKVLPGMKQEVTLLRTWPGPIPGQLLHRACCHYFSEVITLVPSGPKQEWDFKFQAGWGDGLVSHFCYSQDLRKLLWMNSECLAQMCFTLNSNAVFVWFLRQSNMNYPVFHLLRKNSYIFVLIVWQTSQF